MEFPYRTMSLDLCTKTHHKWRSTVQWTWICLATSNFGRLVQVSSNVQDDQQDGSRDAVPGYVVASLDHGEHRSDPGRRVNRFLLAIPMFETLCSFHSSTLLRP